jgi:hypothetical protein
MLPQNGIAAVYPPFALADESEAQFRLAESSTYKENISGARSGPQNCPASPRLSHDGHVYKDVSPLGRITAGQYASKSLGGPAQPLQKSMKPLAGVRDGQSQTQQEAPRLPTHGDHVAQSAGQAFPPHRIRRMLVSKEMSALQEPVTGEKLIESPCASKDRRIVAGAQTHSRAANSCLGSDRCDPFQKDILPPSQEIDREVLCFLHSWRRV